MKFAEKKYIHKHKDENVLIYNVRRALPRKIYSDVFEKTVLAALPQEEQKLLLKYYSQETFIYLLEKKPDEKPYYILHSIPNEIEARFAMNILNTLKIPLPEQRRLLKYYYRNKLTNLFVLKENITESDELQILTVLKMFRSWYITDSKKTKISEVLEKVPNLEKEDIFFANMHVNIHHQFFFEHPNEHVPAMMTIEAARQFLIACCHMYFKVPLKGVNFILSGMQCKFYNYLELNYPIKLMAKVNTIKYRRGYLNYLDLDIKVYQNNKIANAFNFVGSVIENAVFKVLREDKTIYEQKPRFIPRSIFYHNIMIRHSNKDKFLCEFVDISEDGFRVKIDKSEEKNLSDSKEPYEFFIFFQDIGFIHGECELKWIKADSDYIICGFLITGIYKGDKENLREALKRYCYVIEERDFF
jgi:A-factor biosynthesis hotdog domain